LEKIIEKIIAKDSNIILIKQQRKKMVKYDGKIKPG
jgi:hypothetical protein